VEDKKEVINILIEDIIPNRFQPRLAFDDKELNELATSIKQHGIIQPLVLRKIADKYEIIAGERRYKAAIIAGLSNVPAIIMEADDNTSAELAIVENVQRKNLNAMEEAQSYKKLADKGFTQEEIAKKIGVNQSTIANKIRLLMLDEEVQDALLNNKISERHARSLLAYQIPLLK
jgi:ParB family chromosome partitioning protein